MRAILKFDSTDRLGIDQSYFSLHSLTHGKLFLNKHRVCHRQISFLTKFQYFNSNIISQRAASINPVEMHRTKEKS